MGLLIGLTYSKGYRGLLLTTSFVHSLVALVPLVACCVGAVRVLSMNDSAQSGQAVAFALVGVLSLIRFRTVLRDTREFTFVLVSISAGVGIGSGLLAATIILVVVVLFILLTLERYNFGAPGAPSFTVHIVGNRESFADYHGRLAELAVRLDFIAVEAQADQHAEFTFEFISVYPSDVQLITSRILDVQGTTYVYLERLQRSRKGD